METTFKALAQTIVNSSKTVEFIKAEKEKNEMRVNEVVTKVIAISKEVVCIVRNEMIAFTEGKITPGYFKVDCAGKSDKTDFIFARGVTTGGLIEYIVNIKVDGKTSIIVDIEDIKNWETFTGESSKFWSIDLVKEELSRSLKKNTELLEESLFVLIKTPIVDVPYILNKGS